MSSVKNWRPVGQWWRVLELRVVERVVRDSRSWQHVRMIKRITKSGWGQPRRLSLGEDGASSNLHGFVCLQGAGGWGGVVAVCIPVPWAVLFLDTKRLE